MPKTAFCLMGPTASGKTDVALELVQHFPFEIISVDSALLYREMDIGTAKPSVALRLKVAHHLIDCINPDESYSVARFIQEAERLMEEIRVRGKIPLLVGGTMMYFNALSKGLSQLPESDEALRREIGQEALLKGWPLMHQELAAVDAETAAKIHANDAQRIGRALEVYRTTGKTLSFLQQKETINLTTRYHPFSLFPENRAWLHERIASRFQKMLEQGFIDEVKGLINQWSLHKDLPSMRTVGYRQALAYLSGEDTYASFREKAIAATRQLAKRQLTWLRHWEGSLNFEPEDPALSTKLMVKIAEILDNNNF